MIQLLASHIPLLVVLVILVDHGACDSINRTSFPPGFLFGASSSAYQYEGAFKEGGRGLSIWDTFTHVYPDKIADGGNGDVADDFYHRYKDDLKNVKKMGMDAFRFSISWPRILPNGSLSGGINKEGINFYNDLIDEIISNGMQPFVTLFHWDLPQAIQDKYMGFLSSAIAKDYADYTDICFREFGDRVKHWITFNEPSLFCSKGYASGIWAPGRCSPWEQGKCSTGNSGTEPYLCGHNILLAHSASVILYRDKYQGIQKGNIGITQNTRWILPHSSSEADTIAAERTLEFMYGWFMHPLAHGDYPIIMRNILGNRLPKFTKEQSELLIGSYDFIGINYYTSYFAINNPRSDSLRLSYDTDYMANLTGERQDGTQLPKPFSDSFINIYAPGLREIVLYTARNYKNPVIYITENGVHELRNKSMPLKDVLNDENRISFHRDHLLTLRSAIIDGADVRGYFAWSFMDNMEWENGYNTRFGLYYVDYSNNLTRHPKKSSFWFSQILKKQNIHYIA